MVLDAFVRLSRTRAQGFNGPANLSLSDLRQVYETGGWEELGMPRGEFDDWMLALDSVFLHYWRDKQ